MIVPEGVNLKLYQMYPPAQWGSILAIRTGPAEPGDLGDATTPPPQLRHVEGHIEREDTGEWIPTPTEEDFFVAAGLPVLPPAVVALFL